MRVLLPVALKQEAKESGEAAAQTRKSEEEDMERESLMLEYEMALGECRDLNKKV